MKIAFYEETLGTRVLNLIDMTVTTVVEPQWEGKQPSWARMQDSLVFIGVNSGEWNLYSKQLPSGARTLVCSGQMPDWSPDDRALVFRGSGITTANNALYRMDLASGIITQLMSVGGEDNPRWPAWRRF